MPSRAAWKPELTPPEELREAIEVTSPNTRLASAALAFIVLAAAAWSVFGTVRTRVQGDGVIAYRDAQRVDVVARAEGYLAALLVREGDRVSQGQVVARVENDALVQRVALARRRQEAAEARITRLEAERDADAGETARLNRRRRAALSRSIASSEALIERLRNAGAARDEDRQERVLELRHEIDRARSEMAAIDGAEREEASAWRRMLEATRQEVAHHRNEVARASAELERMQRIRAATDGEIVEVLAGVGTFLHPDDGIYRMTNRVSGLFASAFFTADEAELIEPGMPVQVSLSMLDRQETGSLRGTVSDVSRFRLSADALRTLLGNERLVERFSRSGAPLAVEIELSRRSDGAYEWTTGRGAQRPVEPGMLVTVSVAIREQRPITLVMPGLRQVLGER